MELKHKDAGKVEKNVGATAAKKAFAKMKGASEEIRILLVEDSKKHITDAKLEVQTRITDGTKIDLDVAEDLSGYFTLSKEKVYDGIVSDVFFPTDQGNPSDNLANNLVWTLLGKAYCEKMHDYDRQYGLDERERRMLHLVQSDWTNTASGELPPSGIIVADYALKEGIPVVLCTDTYHHGTKTQPVHDWAGGKKVRMIDTYPKVDRFEAQAPSKDWKAAFDEIIDRILETRAEELPTCVPPRGMPDDDDL